MSRARTSARNLHFTRQFCCFTRLNENLTMKKPETRKMKNCLQIQNLWPLKFSKDILGNLHIWIWFVNFFGGLSMNSKRFYKEEINDISVKRTLLFWSDFIFKDSFGILNIKAKKMYCRFSCFTVFHGQLLFEF